MSEYKHGVYTSEVATSVTSPVQVSAGLPIFIGRAPVNLVLDPRAYVNKPLLAYTYAEAVAALGYTDDYKNYELCEAMYVLFKLYQVAPVVFINVLDPETHKTAVADASLTLTSGAATIDKTGVMLNSLTVKLTQASQTLKKGTDYTVAFDDHNKPLITAITGGALDSQTTIYVSYNHLDPTKVTSTDIIGGVDATTGAVSGSECIDQVFPKLGLVPGLLAAPGWTEKSAVAAVLKAKATSINTLFKAMAVCDIDCTADGADIYTEVYAWKSENNYTSEFQINCWPKAVLDSTVFRLSTQLIGLICYTDSKNDDIPYVSPSNQTMQIDGIKNAAGHEIVLGPDQAAYLNGKGVVTATNLMGAWKAWGNRTGIYPTSTDPKDAWIPVRRMFNWIGNTLIVTYWQKVDAPTNKRLIQTVVDSINIWLNGLTAKGALLGGYVEYRSDENPETDLINGINRFHVHVTPPIPNEDMEFILEFDVSYFETLFAA